MSLLVLAGCASSPADEPANQLERSVTVPAGEFVEANLQMGENDTIRYEWSTSNGTQLSFDVHSHGQGGVETYETARGAVGQGSFAAPGNDTFSLLWANEGEEPAELSFSIAGSFSVDSIVP